jgi:hypothetical protein
MSQPHPPHPEDPPAQPGDQQEPRTQAIPVVTPGGQAGIQPGSEPLAPPEPGRPAPGPAFSTEASYHPGLASGPAGEPPAPPATPGGPPPGGVPQSAGPQTMPPQPLPPGQVWPQPGSTPPGSPPPGGQPAAPDPAWSAQPGGRLDFIPGFAADAGGPDAATSAGSTAAPPAPGPAGPPPPGWTPPGSGQQPGSPPPGSPRPTGQLPAAGPEAVPGTAPQPAAGPGGTAKRLGARLGGGLRGGGSPAGASRGAGSLAGGPRGGGRGAGVRRGGSVDRRTLLGLVLGLVGLVLLELGLLREFGSDSLWSVVPTWSAFATVAALVGLLPLLLRWVPAGLGAGPGWRVGLAGVIGLGVFWVLVALPLVASDRGFLLTAGPALAAAALWLAPGRGGGQQAGAVAGGTSPGGTSAGGGPRGGAA